MSTPMWELFHQADDCISPLQRLLGDLHPAGARPAPNTLIWAPPLEVSQTDICYYVHSSVPDGWREWVNVSLKSGVVTFRGEQRHGSGAAHRNTVFMRSYSLPADVAEDDVAVAFKEGVLVIRLPRRGPQYLRGTEIGWD